MPKKKKTEDNRTPWLDHVFEQAEKHGKEFRFDVDCQIQISFDPDTNTIFEHRVLTAKDKKHFKGDTTFSTPVAQRQKSITPLQINRGGS